MYAELALDTAVKRSNLRKGLEALPAQEHGCILNAVPLGKHQQGLPGIKLSKPMFYYKIIPHDSVAIDKLLRLSKKNLPRFSICITIEASNNACCGNISW